MPSRAKRPLSTVIVDERLKKQFVDDVRDFMDLKTLARYNRRCIPCRRGYLLSGPLGTVKSSLSAAVAGEFGLDIYIVDIPSTNEHRSNTPLNRAQSPVGMHDTNPPTVQPEPDKRSSPASDAPIVASFALADIDADFRAWLELSAFEDNAVTDGNGHGEDDILPLGGAAFPIFEC